MANQKSRHPGLAGVSAQIRDRLLKYTALFVIVWGLDSLCVVLAAFWGTRVRQERVLGG